MQVAQAPLSYYGQRAQMLEARFQQLKELAVSVAQDHFDADEHQDLRQLRSDLISLDRQGRSWGRRERDRSATIQHKQQRAEKLADQHSGWNRALHICKEKWRADIVWRDFNPTDEMKAAGYRGIEYCLSQSLLNPGMTLWAFPIFGAPAGIGTDPHNMVVYSVTPSHGARRAFMDLQNQGLASSPLLAQVLRDLKISPKSFCEV